MKRYLSYKYSGNELIGDIPDTWTACRLKNVLSSPLQYGANESGIPFDEALPRYIRITDVSNDGALKDEGKLSLPESIAKDYLLDNEDILLARSGATVGKAFFYLAEYGRAAFAGYMIKAKINRNIILPKLLYYSTLSAYYENWKASMSIQATIQNIGANRYNDLPIVIPKQEEQKAIITYLDNCIQNTDTLISEAKASIEEYKAWKASIIYEAVTKGLDKDAEMKDSGFEWIGNMPAHWRLIQNKHVMRKQKRICDSYKGQDIISLTMNGVIIRDLGAGGKMPTTFDGYQFVYPGELLMCLFDIDVTPRCVGRVYNEGLTSPAYSCFVLNDGMILDYYYYYYLMMDNTKELLHLAKNLRHSLTEEQLGQIKVPVPPVEEQVQIGKELDEKTEMIDSLISEKESLISDLEDYKKSLIFEVVTGKRKVV